MKKEWGQAGGRDQCSVSFSAGWVTGKALKNLCHLYPTILRWQAHAMQWLTPTALYQIKSNTNLYSAKYHKRVRGAGDGTRPDRLR